MKDHEYCRSSREHRIKHYQNSDINDKLIFNLRDLSHVMRALYEGKGSQERILIVLKETGEITQSALTECLGIQPGSASEVFGKMEAAGLIIRIPSDIDRRTANIILTEKGIEFADNAANKRHRRHEDMFSCLSEYEKTELLSTLEKINSDWEQRYVASGKINSSSNEKHKHLNHGKHIEKS